MLLRKAGCLPFSIDEMLAETYAYLDKSSKRLASLESWQKIYDVEHHKILKHVSTRWLSVGKCVDHILLNWEALKKFFKDEVKTGTSASKKLEMLESFYGSPTNRLYCLFLQEVLKIFDGVNTSLQSEKPKIHLLRRSLHKLLRMLLLRFVNPGALQGKTVTDVKFQVELYHKKDSNLILGENVRQFIRDKEENKLRDSRIEEFYQVSSTTY